MRSTHRPRPVRSASVVGLLVSSLLVAGLVGVGDPGLTGVAGAASADELVPLTPSRILDTRTGVGRPAGTVPRTGTIDVQVTGQGGVPTSGVAAVVLNVTVTEPSTEGYLTIWPTGQARPLASAVNFRPGQTVANGAFVALGDGGRISIYNKAGPGHIVVDVTAYVPDTSSYRAVRPVRRHDTREQGGAVAAGETRRLPLTGDAVPADAVAVVFNLTVTQPRGSGYVTVHPAGTTRPLASSVNFAPGETVANQVVTGLGSGGSAAGAVEVFASGSSGSVHVVVDVVGWFGVGSTYRPIVPERVLDTRSGTGRPFARSAHGEEVITVDVSRLAALPSTYPSAVVLNLTSTGSTAGGHVTQWPTGRSRPLASTLNVGPYETNANLVVARVGANGNLSLVVNQGRMHLVADVVGVLPADRAPVAPTLGVSTLVSGLNIPWGLDFAPDGTLVFTERSGRLLVRRPTGVVGAVAIDTTDLFARGETGLLDVELDPEFAANRRFYTCQGHADARSPSPRVQVIAWAMAEDWTNAVRVADPLVGGLPTGSNGRHGGCRLLVDGEGALRISTGDATVGTAPQDLSSLGGKTLRVHRFTGAAWPSNPYSGSADANTRRVVTSGHRNPQGLTIRPGTGQVWTAEHGPARDDEVNQIRPGANHGWNPVPGYDESVPMTDLVEFPDATPAVWSSGSPTVAPSGATFLSGPQWGAWDGALAVAMLKRQELWIMTLSGDRLDSITVPRALDGTHGRLRTPVQGPDGALYVTTSNGGGHDEILRIAPSV